MSKYLDLSIKEINKLLKEKKVKPIDLVNEAFERIESNEDLNCFITLNREEAIKKATELESKEVDNLFFGIPIAIKDNICTEGLRTTCASKILENFVPIYNATVIDMINDKNMIIVGKTNMDEFAMGSCSKTSYFGAPHNPWNKDKITGGSSGGSAACVSARLIPLALGSDTGGSIRQPAAHCGIVGMKPTYGRVSRYGLVAFASSLDQIGPMTRNVLENAELLNILVGKDEKDLTSARCDYEDFTRLIGKDIKGLKIAVPKYFVSDIVSKEVLDNFNKIVELLKKCGCTVDYIDVDYIENAVTLYQIIAMGEASGNLARFDGVKYGLRADDYEGLHDMYKKTRKEGFGTEVKRRIMLGSFVLSSGYYDAYYLKALRVRNLIKQEFDKLFKEFDVILSPVSPETTPKIGESLSDPIKMYLSDVYTVSANLTGMPGISIPCGIDRNNMPVGMQLFADHFREDNIIKAAYAFEKAGKGM